MSTVSKCCFNFALIALFCAQNTIFAQGKPQANEAQYAGTLDTVYATAYRFLTPNLETPANTVQISAEKLENSQYTNVAEALKNFANLNFRSVTSSMASGDFAMRGFGENSQTRIMVVVDNHRINRPDMGAINWLQIPLSSIESMEVLRGSQTALYGSAASAGVIKIKTKRPKENSYVFKGLYGSYQTYDLAAQASLVEGDFFANIGLNYFNSAGWRDNSASDAISANLSLGYDINESNSLVFSGNYTDSNTMYAGPLTLAQCNTNPQQSFYNSKSYSKDGSYSLSLDTQSAAGEGDVGLGWNFRDIFWDMGGKTKNFQYTASFTPKYKFETSENTHILVGFDGEYSNIDFKRLHDGSAPYKGYADASQISAEPYIGGDCTLFEKLILNAVGRISFSRLSVDNTEFKQNSLDEFREISIGGTTILVPNPDWPPQINPANTYKEHVSFTGFGANFGATYLVENNTSLFFKFDQIYHYPVADEICSYQTYGGLSVPFNKDLSPEKGQNYEVGVKFENENWKLTGSFFLNMLVDEISYYQTLTPSGLEWLNTNLDPTMRFGTDISLEYDAKIWGFSAMFSAVKAQFLEGENDGNEIPLVPNFSGTLSAFVRPIEPLTLSFSASFLSDQYVGSDYENTTAKIPAYALLSLRANYKICKYASCFVAVDNLLDKRYISCAWKSGYYPGIGRTFSAGITLTY